MNETILAYPEPFFDMFGMSPCNLEERLNILALDLINPNAHRDTIGPGKSLQSLYGACLQVMLLLQLHKVIESGCKCIGRMVKKACKILWDRLLENGNLKHLKDFQQWSEIVEDFENKRLQLI